MLVWHVLSNYPSTTSPPHRSTQDGLAVNLSVGQVNPDKGNISRIYQHSSKTYLSNNIQEAFKKARVLSLKRVTEINWNLRYAIFSTAGSIVYKYCTRPISRYLYSGILFLWIRNTKSSKIDYIHTICLSC